MLFQQATDGEFRGTVEQITGRKVRGCVSGIDTEHDLSSEALDPAKHIQHA